MRLDRTHVEKVGEGEKWYVAVSPLMDRLHTLSVACKALEDSDAAPSASSMLKKIMDELHEAVNS